MSGKHISTWLLESKLSDLLVRNRYTRPLIFRSHRARQRDEVAKYLMGGG